MADPIIVPRRQKDYFTENGDLALRAFKFFEALTTQTNESVIVITDTGTELTSTASRVSRDAAKINSLELKEFEIVSTTTDLTTEEFQIIICKNESPIIITLDPQAIENDEVHIKRRVGKIKVIGSIDGALFKNINVINYSMHLVFDGTDWSEI